jgi:hypothetical protein
MRGLSVTERFVIGSISNISMGEAGSPLVNAWTGEPSYPYRAHSTTSTALLAVNVQPVIGAAALTKPTVKQQFS